jgi:biopolymer transport protein TolR
MPVAEINVTPMVDVMLVLLIIFMVTAPLLVAGVPVNLPDSRAKSLDQGKKPLQVSLDAEARLFIDAEQINIEDLPAYLAKAAKNGEVEGPQVYLRADKGLGYGVVMSVMGEINRAGLTRVALVTTSGTEAVEPEADARGAQ